MERNIIKSREYTKYFSILIIVLLIGMSILLLNNIVDGKFITSINIKLLLIGATIPTFTAWALSFIFASNITDFSIGSVIILSATIAGALGNKFGVIGVIIGGVFAGVFLMFINFKVYTITKIPSWIAGMGMTMIYESITVIYANLRLQKGLQVIQLKDEIRILAHAPNIFIILFIGGVVAYLIYNKTSIGLQIRAVGSAEEVSKMMGIDIIKALVSCGVVAGMFLGVSGFLTESYAGRAIPLTGLSSISTIFQPMAALLLAQVMQKYINIIIAIPISTILITAIFNIMTLLGISSGTWQQAMLGIIVIIFGVIAQKNEKGVVK